MGTYCSVKVLLSSQMMIGRFLRSLKVGRRTEYLFLTAIVEELEGGRERR